VRARLLVLGYAALGGLAGAILMVVVLALAAEPVQQGVSAAATAVGVVRDQWWRSGFTYEP
jgi:hypothetical protein